MAISLDSEVDNLLPYWKQHTLLILVLSSIPWWWDLHTEVGDKRDPVVEHQDILWIVRELGGGYFSWTPISPEEEQMRRKWGPSCTNKNDVYGNESFVGASESTVDIVGPFCSEIPLSSTRHFGSRHHCNCINVVRHKHSRLKAVDLLVTYGD